MKYSARITLFVSFFLLFLLLPFSVLAQKPADVFNRTIDQMIQDEKSAQEEEAQDGETRVFLDRTNRAELGSTMGNLTCMILPCGAVNEDQATALQSIAGLMTDMYQHPPASGLAYTIDVLQTAGFVRPAYAQGLGFAGFLPLLPLWKTTRNIAYSVIIVVMVSIGFMVIFRMKIDPKTVISVQAAIPKIILTLIVITFSYPIVGFLVDIMYLTMAILIAIIAQGIGQAARTAELQTYFMTAGSLQLLGTVFSGGFSGFDDFILRNNLGAYVGASTGVSVILGALGAVGSFLGASVIGTVASPLLVGFGGVAGILVVILALGLLFTFIRLLLLLMNSYIQLLLAVVLGPILLLNEAIPGKSAFTQWIFNILANLSPFPTTVAVLMFAQYLTESNFSTPLFSPPLIGVPGEGAFPAFLGLGVLFLAPTIVASIKKLFNPQPALPLTVGTLLAPLTGGVQTGLGAMSQFYYLQHSPLGRFFPGQQQH